MLALTILQDWLDEVSDKVMSGDEAGFVSSFALPLTVRADAGDSHMTRPEDLQAKFRAWRQTIEQMRVIELCRTARRAEFVEVDRIAGLYETLMLTDRGPAMDRFNSSIALTRTLNGDWICTDITTGLAAVEKHLYYTSPRADDAGTDRKDET